MTQAQQDELSHLFARNLHVTAPHPATPDQQFSCHYSVASAPIYSSQHYTQTAHIRPGPATHSASAPAIGQRDNLELILRQYGIDSTSLLPSQISLFQNAHDEQRTRLLELWRISSSASETGNVERQGWGAASMNVILPGEPRNFAQNNYMSRRHAQQQHLATEQDIVTDSEPYMSDGYELYSHGTDPVNAASIAQSQEQSYNQAVQDHHVASEQARQFEHLQRLHHAVEQTRLAIVHTDAEMAM